MSEKARQRLILLALLAVAAGVLIFFAKVPFRRWQERRLVDAAQRFMEKGELRDAYLSSREALLKNPKSIPACSIVAQIAELEQSPAAILWRQQLTDLQPGSSGPLIDLATTATRFGETFIAEQSLSQVREADRNDLPFLQASASLAIAQKSYDIAERYFQKALEITPGDDGLRLNLANIRLASGRPEQIAQARATLESLQAKPQFRQAALRAMISDARLRGDSARAMQLTTKLNQDANATMGDRLLQLDELDHSKSKEFTPELSKLQTLAGNRPELIYLVMTWMNAHGLPAQSLEWCESLPGKIRAQMPVPLAEAEARTALADWKKLRDLVKESDWGDLEFMRLALHSRVLFETDGRRRRSEFRAMWESATNATRGNPNALVMLGRLVNGWGWKQEAIEAWWLAAKNNTGGRAALKALFTHYSAEKNTRELYRVARRVAEVEPANPIAKNNVASLALLLGLDEPEAHRLAAENYKLAPAQPVVAATYAFSLHRKKRTGEAVAILKQLPPSALADPSIAACYGFLLAQNGEPGAARQFLDAANREKEKLFPEEVALIDSALKGLP
ncbi:MAG: tetratricopeptide repeat protein [Chthoniobacteraceae bacterium]